MAVTNDEQFNNLTDVELWFSNFPSFLLSAQRWSRHVLSHLASTNSILNFQNTTEQTNDLSPGFYRSTSLRRLIIGLGEHREKVMNVWAERGEMNVGCSVISAISVQMSARLFILFFLIKPQSYQTASYCCCHGDRKV